MEENRQSWAAFARFVLRRLLLIEGIIVVTVGAIYLVAGGRDAIEYGWALLVVGVIVFSIGPFSMLGGWSATRNWQYQYIESMNQQKISERARRDKADLQQNYGLVVPSVLIGSLTIGLALLIQFAAG